ENIRRAVRSQRSPLELHLAVRERYCDVWNLESALEELQKQVDPVAAKGSVKGMLTRFGVEPARGSAKPVPPRQGPPAAFPPRRQPRCRVGRRGAPGSTG